MLATFLILFLDAMPAYTPPTHILGVVENTVNILENRLTF